MKPNATTDDERLIGEFQKSEGQRVAISVGKWHGYNYVYVRLFRDDPNAPPGRGPLSLCFKPETARELGTLVSEAATVCDARDAESAKSRHSRA